MRGCACASRDRQGDGGAGTPSGLTLRTKRRTEDLRETCLMTPRILAIGGGGFLMEDTPSPVDRYIARLTGRDRPRVCFISTPSGDSVESIEKFYAAFESLGCEAAHLAFFRKPFRASLSLASFAELVLTQDAIFVGGGNTKSALAVWREWGLDRVLAEARRRGILLSGISAGAMC